MSNRDVSFWKEVFMRTFRIAKNLESYFVGVLCEEIAFRILKSLFPNCKIRKVGDNCGAYDLAVICYNEHDKVLVEVKHISYLNNEKWQNLSRMHLKSALRQLLGGRHYLYIFVDSETGKYVIRHALYIIKTVSSFTLLKRAHAKTFRELVRKFIASRSYLTYKAYGIRFHPALKRR